ncbi:NTF2 fold immunity protein [Paenibacillus sp. OSY-SE]|uniref:NTF2 fold immunity protein n=1 Tax=Paenibacillus sp. OSY-SE TaxID=1196323 RepID=UPI00031371D8|nr:NTF2 fold immunity protein [Paenibacillus sp. OSY-SE]
MDQQELNKHLVHIVQEYGSKWNNIEDHIYKQYEQEEAELREKYTGDEYHYVQRTDWHEQFSGLIGPIFVEYCTDKKRVYGGRSRQSFGFPVKFNGIEHFIETNVELKNKNRAEVYFKTETNFNDEYLFVLLRKADTWKIDNYKNRRYGNEKWNTCIL